MKTSVFSQDCTILSKANNITPSGLCAPVSLTWDIVYRGVNDGGSVVEIQINWDDGTAPVNISATNTNIPLGEWTVNTGHIYPPGGTQCNYNPTAMIVVDGTVCTSSVQVQNVTVWDNDDSNGGQMEIAPQVFPICIGNDGTVNFQDVSLWNCVPPDENDVPNGYARWTQWIYGTAYTIANIEVDGVVESYPLDGNIDFYPATVYGPFPANSISLPVYSPNTALVGQMFQVTLRNWNYCNPYDDPLLPGPPADLANGDNPPVTTTAMILIVDIPDATITPVDPFCANEPALNLSAATPGGTWSGTGITNTSNGTFNPTVAGVSTHTITYTITDGNGCVGTDTYDIVVVANPNANISTDIPPFVCPGEAIQLNGNPSGGTPAYGNLWSGSTLPLSNSSIVNPIFLSNTQGTYNLTYTVSDASGCSSSDIISIQVYDITAAILPDPAEICAGGNLLLDGNPSGGSGNYINHLWTGVTIYLNDTSIQNPIFNSGIIGTYNLTYLVTDDNGCSGSDNISVTVSEVPVSNAGNEDTICGSSYTLGAISSVGSGSWSLVSGPGTVGFTIPSSSSSIVTITNYGTYTFEWRESNGPGCTDRDTVEIHFVEQPVADAGSDISVCGLLTNLNAVPSAGTGVWTQTAGIDVVSITSLSSPNSGLIAPSYGVYQFTWTEDNGNGCVDSDATLVTFNVLPSPSFTPDSTGCSPLTINFANQSQNASSYSWDFGDGNSSVSTSPSNTFVNSTSNDVSYLVELTVFTGGCSGTFIRTITVHPPSLSNFLSNAIPDCSPVSASFTNLSSSATSYEWNFGEGTPVETSTNASHVFTNDTTFIEYFMVSLTAISMDGCRDSMTRIVQVYPLPVASFTTTPDSACHPAGIVFSALPWASTYNWNFGDGTSDNVSGANVVHNYFNTGNDDTSYTITLEVISSLACRDTSVSEIIIHPKPIASFNADQYSGCTPFTTSLNNTSTGATTYYWRYGDGSGDTTSLLTGTHIFTNNISVPVTYVVRLTVENYAGCRDSIEKTIIVMPEIIANFISPTTGCSPFSVQYTNQTIGAISYIWDFGDGSLSGIPNPSHTFITMGENDTSFITQLVATSAYTCTDTIQDTITVYPKPVALCYPDSTEGCSPFNAMISNLSEGADSYLWIFGDGDSLVSSDTLIQHTFVNTISSPISLTIELQVENSRGCADNFYGLVTVFPGVNADFLSDTAGCSPHGLQFFNQSIGAVSYKWDFGDGGASTSLSPVHTYINSSFEDTVFIAQLVATSGYACRDTVITAINVYPTPIANYLIKNSDGCSPFVVEISNLSIGADDFLWTFGDSETSTSADSIIYHTYVNTISTLNVNDFSLTVENNYGCTDQKSGNITSYPEIRSKFIADTVGCSPFPVSFINQSDGASYYDWDFGDGTSTTNNEPDHTFLNWTADNVIHTVELIVRSQFDCADTSTLNVTVLPSPVADFTASPASQVYPATTVSYTNGTNPGSWVYSWDFGDLSTSSDANPPDHSYPNWGEYEIKLKVQNWQCSDSLIQSITILPPIPLAAFGSSQQGCAPLSASFVNHSQNASEYYWEFGDGLTSTQKNPSYTYYDPGTYMVSLTVTGPGGQAVADPVLIEVYKSPTANFTVAPKLIYIPEQPVHCYNLSENADFYLWDFGDGNTSAVESPLYVYQDEGVFDIMLTAYTEHNCRDSILQERAVTATKSGDILYPSAFTPNPDGSSGGSYAAGQYDNNIFYPAHKGITEYHLQIFNRWGELIFESKDVNIGWDGYYRETLCKQDVYVWKVRGKYSNGSSFVQAGDVTLLR